MHEALQKAIELDRELATEKRKKVWLDKQPQEIHDDEPPLKKIKLTEGEEAKREY